MEVFLQTISFKPLNDKYFARSLLFLLGIQEHKPVGGIARSIYKDMIFQDNDGYIIRVTFIFQTASQVVPFFKYSVLILSNEKIVNHGS